MSVCAALTTSMPLRHADATDYTAPVTGSAVTDSSYPTATDDSGHLIYSFSAGDSISTSTATDANITAINLVNAATPVVLQSETDDAGTLDISTSRTAVSDWGTAFGVNVEGWGSNLTVNGNTNITATTDNANSSAIGIRVYQGTATFNGDTTVTTNTPGYSQGVWIYQGQVTFNGDTTIHAHAKRESTTGIYNSGGGTGNVVFNGNVTIDALGTWPSDNVHGIYNDNGNTKLTINGDLDISAVSNGSTVFGIRNQGRLAVSGDAKVVATGPRSALGIANTYSTASMYFGGDVDIEVVNGTAYTPYGLPTAIQNIYGRSSSMTFEGNVKADISSTTTAYGIDNTGVINFDDANGAVTLNATSSCDGCQVFDIINSGGAINDAGGFIASASASNGTAYAIYNTPYSSDAGVININTSGQGKVTIDGNIVTANLIEQGLTGTTNIWLNTADSYFSGNVLNFTDSGVVADSNRETGATWLMFTNGAAWKPTGAGTVNSDFGAGGLTVGSGGSIDLSAYWGSFEPGSIPAYSFRTLNIDSSTGNGTVNLGDGATFKLLSDISNGAADKIVFGSGISSFSATGTQKVAIAYDPVLDDTSWVNPSTIANGKTFNASSPITIVDASAAASGTATIAAVAGSTSSWSQTYENDLVSYSYTPQVAVSSDGNKILLTGIQIAGNGSSNQGDSSGSSGDASASQGTSSSGSGSDGSGSSGNAGSSTGGAVTSIRPAEAILTASESADAMRNLLLQTAGWTRASVNRSANHPDDAQDHAWATPVASHGHVDTRYDRRYDQDITAVNLGADRRIYSGDVGTLRLGASFTQGRSDIDYTRGKGTIDITTLAGHATFKARSGAYVTGSVGASYLSSDYSATNQEDSTSIGTFHAKAVHATVEAGYPFDMGHGMTLEPSASVVGGVLSGDHDVTSAGVSMNMPRTSFGMAKAGVTLRHEGTTGPVAHELYGRVARLQTFGDNMPITASKDGGSISTTAANGQHGGYEAALGVSANLGRSRNLTLSLEGSKQQLSGAGSAWTGLVTLKYRW